MFKEMLSVLILTSYDLRKIFSSQNLEECHDEFTATIYFSWETPH